jgi:hypothetical protein
MWNSIVKRTEENGICGVIYWNGFSQSAKGHFTHEIESPWPLHFKHSHAWKRRGRSKSASHYALKINGVCECKMDVKFAWIPTWHQMDRVSWSLGLISREPPLGGQPNTNPGDHGTPNAHIHWFILFFYHVWGGPTWIDIHWNNIWLRPCHIWVHTTLEGPCPTSWFWRCLGTAFGHPLLGSHNFMVTAPGSCVKWP